MIWMKRIAIIAVVLSCLFLVGCVRWSGGTWMVESAATPEGWPELTPIGEVEIREYPVYREARVGDAEAEASSMRPMFRELFRHIQDGDIAMTAPVAMTYTEEDDPGMNSMSFLYRTTDIGTLGQDGDVAVLEIEPQTFASVGMRGDYTESRFREGVTLVEAWLADHEAEWLADGHPRYLGYNSPFVLPFMRYGEVQVPVRPANP